MDWRENQEQLHELRDMDPIRLYWTLLTGRKSALAAKYIPRGVLLLGAGTEIEIKEGPSPDPQKGCPTLIAKDGGVRLIIEPGEVLRYDCKFEVETRDLTLETTTTDFALVVNRLFGTWVAVMEGRVRVELVRSADSFELLAGEAALVRGKRVWRRRAVELGSAPPGAPRLPPLPDPPLLPMVAPLPRLP